MALTGLLGTWMSLADELVLGVAQLDGSGCVLELNDTARQLLDSPAGTAVREACADLCSRAGSLTRPAELMMSSGAAGAVHVLLARTTGQPLGYLALLERSITARLRAEGVALRAMLASAVDSAPPREAAMRALSTIAATVADCGLVLHEVCEGSGTLVPMAQAGLDPARTALASELPLGPEASTVGRVVASGQSIHLPDVSRSPFAWERALAKEGRWALLAVPVWRGGEVSGVLTVFHRGVLGEGELRMIQGLADAMGMVLERAHADAVLAAEVAARRSLLDHLPDAIVEQGRAGVISLAGGRLEPILGRTAEEVVGLTISDLLAAEERESFRSLVAEVREGVPLAGELNVLTPAGARVPCEVSVSSSGESGGAILRAVFRDISTRRALEADVIRAREVAMRREKLAAIGQLAAGVAHEINNPLSFVKSNLSTMRDHLEDLAGRVARIAPLLEPPNDGGLSAEEIVAEMRDMASESHTGVDRIASIVQALKGMARTRGDDRIAFSPAKAIQDAILIFRGAKNGCEIELELEPLPSIKGSPGALGQVVLNLLDNALDAMNGTGTIRVKGVDAGERVRLTVADSGAGIPEDARGRLFEPFFTTKESGKGTGLGLYICREIVKQMCGEIAFETGPSGTTFAVEIPAIG